MKRYGKVGNMRVNRLKGLLLLIVSFFFVFQGCISFSYSGIEEAEKEIVPKAPEFILGPGDRVEIVVYRYDNLTRVTQIDLSGRIMFPLIGDIQAAGLSIFKLRDKIREGLSRYMIDPQISIGIVSIQSQKIIVLGEVNNPGFFQAENYMTVLEVISRAGGFTADGKQNSVLLIRGGMQKPQLMKLNLQNVLSKGDLTQNIALQRSDIIYVPRTVISNVNRFFATLSNIISPIVSLESGYFIGQQIEGSRGSASTTP